MASSNTVWSVAGNASMAECSCKAGIEAKIGACSVILSEGSSTLGLDSTGLHGDGDRGGEDSPGSPSYRGMENLLWYVGVLISIVCSMALSSAFIAIFAVCQSLGQVEISQFLWPTGCFPTLGHVAQVERRM